MLDSSPQGKLPGLGPAYLASLLPSAMRRAKGSTGPRAARVRMVGRLEHLSRTSWSSDPFCRALFQFSFQLIYQLTSLSEHVHGTPMPEVVS